MTMASVINQTLMDFKNWTLNALNGLIYIPYINTAFEVFKNPQFRDVFVNAPFISL